MAVDDDSCGEVELNTTAAELVVLRRAIEDARSEARIATMSARKAQRALARSTRKAERASARSARKGKETLARQRERMEKALARERARIAEAKRLAKKWQRDSESAKRKYGRITASTTWKISVRLSQALAIMRRSLRAPVFWMRTTLHKTSPRAVGVSLQDVRLPENIDNKPGAEKPVVGAVSLKVRAPKSKVRAPKPKVRAPKPKVRTPKLSANGKIKSKAPPSGKGLSPQSASPAEHRPPDLCSLRTMSPGGRIAAVLHLYYPELWPDFRDALGTIPEPVDLFVTLTAGRSEHAADWIRADFPTAQIITLENLGRDVFPFVTLINSGVLFRYQLVCKLHTKRSLYREDGDAWRRDLLSGVLSDPDQVARILAAFDTDPGLGIVVADGSAQSEAGTWLRHVPWVNELCARVGISAVTAESGWPEFPAGAIYWARSSVLEPIASLMLTAADFEPEPLPPNSIPHAFERLVGHLCREAGLYVARSSVFSDQNNHQDVTSSKAIKGSA